MLDCLKQHSYWSIAVLYWIFSAAVSSLPDPEPTSRPGYTWLFRFLHTIAGNLYRAFGNRIHVLKVLAGIMVLPVLFSTTACAAHYPVHPGALNVTDSAAYDVLLVAEATIDQARLDIQAGTLPDSAKSALNTLIGAYNVARESWLTYRGVLNTDVPIQSYFDQLNQNMSALTAALKQFEEAK